MCRSKWFKWQNVSVAELLSKTECYMNIDKVGLFTVYQEDNSEKGSIYSIHYYFLSLLQCYISHSFFEMRDI